MGIRWGKSIFRDTGPLHMAYSRGLSQHNAIPVCLMAVVRQLCTEQGLSLALDNPVVIWQLQNLSFCSFYTEVLQLFLHRFENYAKGLVDT